MERYRRSQLDGAGITQRFLQSNISYSGKGIVRGIHYQEGDAGQGKLLQVLKGTIFDIVVDVQPDSPMFGEWVSVEISAEKGNLLYVPPQYGHAFCVMSDDALLIYDVTHEYAPTEERGVLWNDPTLAIPWPVTAEDAIVSAKDQVLPTLESIRSGARS